MKSTLRLLTIFVSHNLVISFSVIFRIRVRFSMPFIILLPPVDFLLLLSEFNSILSIKNCLRLLVKFYIFIYSVKLIFFIWILIILIIFFVPINPSLQPRPTPISLLKPRFSDNSEITLPFIRKQQQNL